MPGSRAPSDARTQRARGLDSPSATEDAAARRVIAGRALPSVAGRATVSVLDSETDGDCERADLLRIADALRHLHARKRIADADAHADQSFELSGEPGQVRRSSRQHDLADTERAGLVLVVLQRGDELARERVHRAAHC